jgi:hypothetical protein
VFLAGLNVKSRFLTTSVRNDGDLSVRNDGDLSVRNDGDLSVWIDGGLSVWIDGGVSVRNDGFAVFVLLGQLLAIHLSFIMSTRKQPEQTDLRWAVVAAVDQNRPGNPNASIHVHSNLSSFKPSVDMLHSEMKATYDFRRRKAYSYLPSVSVSC